MSLGAAQSADQDFDAVVGTFRKVTELQPKNVGAWINLGKAYAIQNRTDEASKAFTKALEIDPRNQVARSLLQKFGRIPKQ